MSRKRIPLNQNGCTANFRIGVPFGQNLQGLLKLAEKYSDALLEAACKKALSYTASPSYKSIKNLLVTGSEKLASEAIDTKTTHKAHGITRGADYYRR